MPGKLGLLLKQLSIRDKFSHQIPLDVDSPFGWAQKIVVDSVESDLASGKPSRHIVLKARQLGISTLSEGLLFLRALTPNYNSAVVADERPNAEELFAKTKLMYETSPWKSLYPVQYYRKNQLTFERHGSSIWVMTAERGRTGHSRTMHAAHLSEVAFWPDPDATMTGLMQAIPNLPGTLVIIESTANGIGNWFEQTWNESVAGANDYTPHFFPWWQHPQYIPCEGENCIDGTCTVCVTRSKGLKASDDEERDLVKRHKVDQAHLAWRRWMIPNKLFGSLDLWHQEYPSTPAEAFIVSGVNAFPPPLLDACYQPTTPGVGYLRQMPSGKIDWVPDPHGPLRVYRRPAQDRSWGSYFIGADPSFGLQDSSDYAAAQVINRRNKEQVAVFQGRVNPYAFADELAKLGRWYNDAMISIEVEGGGYGTIGRLVDVYPHLWRWHIPDRTKDYQKSSSVVGWSSNYKRKAWAITQLALSLEQHALILHDKATYDEMRQYTFYGSKGGHDVFESAGDARDDLVMALSIAIVCESTEPKVRAYEAREGIRPDGVIMPGEQEPYADWGG